MSSSRQIAAELVFRSTLIAFSKSMWDLSNAHEGILPKGPCFIYGNHSNNYDPFILNAFTELGQCTAGVMTKHYLDKGPIAALFKASGIVGTEKRVPEPHLIRKIWKMADEGRRIVIFPEGGRRWDGRPAPWIESTAKLFMRLGIPVYPIQIHGSYVAWPRWATYPRPARIRLSVGAAIDFSDQPSLEVGLERLKAPIAFDENVVDPSISPKRAFRPVAGLSKLLYRDPETGIFGGLEEKGSTTLQQRSGLKKWMVRPDSTLMESVSQEIRLTGDFYHEIKNLPLEAGTSVALLQNKARVTLHSLEGDKKYAGIENVALFHDRIEFSTAANLDLENIRYTGLEKSDTLWILTNTTKIHIVLKYGGSVLAWQDVLSRLIPGLNS